MLDASESERIREERAVMENWRSYSSHVIADLLEACAVCGMVCAKEHLTRCRWCEDVYYCKEGLCAQQHHADVHPAVAFWTW